MRYVKLKTTVSKIVDENVDDLKIIKSIITVVRDQEITCSLRLSDGPKFSGVRIDKINDDSFSFKVITSMSTLRKKAAFSDLDYFEVNTSADIMCRAKPNVSRWSLLDPLADFPESGDVV